MAEELGEKTEDPTARRMLESRNRGQVAKSQDLSAAMMLAAGMILVVVFGIAVVSRLDLIMRRVLGGDLPGEVWDTGATINAFVWSMVQAGLVVAPFMLLLAVIAWVTQVLQVGLLITSKPIQPKLNRLSPIAGFKRVFSLRSLVKSAVNIVKLVFVVGVSVLVIRRNLPELAQLPLLEMKAAVVALAWIVFELVVWLVVLLLAIGLIDLVYQRWQHRKDLKMTKQEVKDERKSMEGDPEVKKRRMKVAFEMARQRINQSVPEADVIVTNPTHFSVALKYDVSTMDAPKMVAKGVDHLALRIRHVAMAHGVPIVERPALARALYWGLEVGQDVPPQHYEAVAEILAYVYRLEGRSMNEPRAARRESGAVAAGA